MQASDLALLLDVAEEEVETSASETALAPAASEPAHHTWDPIDLTRRLVLSCERGHTDIVRLLIEAGSSVNQPNTRGVAPIFAASDRGHVDCVRQLLLHGAEVNAEGATQGQSTLGRQKRSALHAVCKRGHLQVASLLIEAGANVDHSAPPPWGTPLHTCCRFQRVELAELLLNHSASVEGMATSRATSPTAASPSATSPTSVSAAASAAASAAPTLLGSGLAGSGEQLESPLLVACRVGNAATVELLVGRGCNVHRLCAGKLPLLAAIEAGHLTIVQVLLDANASANASAPDGVTPLLASCRHGDVEVTKLLMVHGAETDPRGGGLAASESALLAGHYACAEVVQLAMEAQTEAVANALLAEEENRQMQPPRAVRKSKSRRRPSLSKEQKAAAALLAAAQLSETERVAAIMGTRHVAANGHEASSPEGSASGANGAGDAAAAEDGGDARHDVDGAAEAGCASASEAGGRGAGSPSAPVPPDSPFRWEHSIPTGGQRGASKLATGQAAEVMEAVGGANGAGLGDTVGEQDADDRGGGSSTALGLVPARRVRPPLSWAPRVERLSGYGAPAAEDPGGESSGETERLLLSVKALRRQLAAQQQQMACVQQQFEQARRHLSIARGELTHDALLQLPLEDLTRAETAAVLALSALQPAIAERRRLDNEARLGEEDARRQCIICFERQKDTVFVPCGHLVTCSGCAELVASCPSCRQPITSKIRTFQD